MVERPLRVGLRAESNDAYVAMARFLLPKPVSQARRLELEQIVFRAGQAGAPDEFHLEICEEGVPVPRGAFVFNRRNPAQTRDRILAEREDLGLVLSRFFPPFRASVTELVIRSVSRENAWFSILTALPDVAPAFANLPWAVSEYASDTAFLTMNQLRMAFLLAAASDRPIGYREQKGEVASILAGAFGWRALARQLIAKIPFGGGLVPKAAIAYAGTYVVGRSLERLYRLGHGYSRAERKSIYAEAFERGKEVGAELVAAVRRRRTA